MCKGIKQRNQNAPTLDHRWVMLGHTRYLYFSLHTLSPVTNTGGWVLPDNTPSHTLPPNKILMRSLIDGFQHETHCLPSHHTGNAPHSESDNVPGFCNTFVDCKKSIGFIRLLLICYSLNIGSASTQKLGMHPVTFLFRYKTMLFISSLQAKQHNYLLSVSL